MKNRFWKMISFVTAMVMIVNCCIYLMPTTSASEETSVSGTSMADVVSEDVSLRGRYEKHFLLSDGTYQAVSYNEPVHKLVDGVWEEIDNTLSLQLDEKGTARYATVDGEVDVSFAQSFQNKLVTMTDEDYSISWGIQPVSNSVSVMAASTYLSAHAELVPIVASGDAETQKLSATKAVSKIRYADALRQGVDVEYIVLPSQVKENIILRSPANITSYVITVQTEGLVAVLTSDRTVEFLNKQQEVVFTMWAPYMYDSAAALSEQIAVHLADKGNGQYVITIVPDAAWLNSAERVYPVVIDPVVAPNRTQSNIIDNYVLEGEGTQNKNLNRLYIGNKSGKTARAFIKYSAMPYIPQDAEIYSGYMRLALTSGTSTMHRASLSMVTGGDWSSGTINWSNMPAANTLVHPYADPFLSDLDGYYVYYFTLTTAVLTWYNNSPTGSNANYGVMVQYYDETIADYNAFYSADCATESIRPYLFIIYGMPEEEPVDIVWPVPNHYYVTSEWGYRNYDSEMHYGIDIRCDEAVVVAAVTGTVEDFTETGGTGYGIVLKARGREFYVYYFHLKEDSYLVEIGDVVEAGDPIAISGNTGNSSGPHLHFELRREKDKNKSYNPIEVYHPDDIRSAWTNPNPMFLYVDEEFIPNPDFDFLYYPSDYNDTDGERWKK